MYDESNEDEAFKTGPTPALESALEGQDGTDSEPSEEGQASTSPLAAGKAPTDQGHSEHSPWPFVAALGTLIVGVGILNQPAIAVVGGIVLLVAATGWLWEPWVD